MCLKVKRSGMLSGGEDPWAHLRQANDSKQRRWLGGNPTFFLGKYTFNSTFIFIIFIFLDALGTMHELSVCVWGGVHPAFSSRSFRYFFMSKRNKNQKIKIKKFYDFLMTNAWIWVYARLSCIKFSILLSFSYSSISEDFWTC